ncbi:hypothetical protein RMSM_06587 [Rhodopirellula maiorica SM1]|uniref:Uncharacterized protein n=1 Tax=Rhodopirellula maiorica SM1 TaxID=1265738 RepID=M5RAG6_9BACT|nr:hypothetical protein RMSM_06587 [Rhodopirellula maiorica SM1]
MQLANLWPRDTRFTVNYRIPLILAKLDSHRAIKFLLSDELFPVDFRSIRQILEAFKTES